MSAAKTVIQPSTPPLSHLSKTRREKVAWFRYLAIGIAALAGIYGVLWVFTLAPGEANPIAATVERVDSDAGSIRTSKKLNTGKAPFAALTFERQREQAQQMLTEFVEAQIRLEEHMSVAAWGAAEYREAKAFAKAGDEAFLEERFEDAHASYQQAREAINNVELLGSELFDDYVATGQSAIESRDPPQATKAFAAALLIKPDDEVAKHGSERAALLPEVMALLRDARNHELGERWGQARATYDAVMALDPETLGVDALRKETNRLQNEAEVRELLSTGFAALDRARYSQARSAFNKVLQISAENPVAIGGLQQVAAKSELGLINSKQRQAIEAEQQEQWQQALEIYEEILALDGNIEFAKLGRGRQKQVLSAHDLLTQVVSSPDKLSSAQLFQEATQIVEQARDLDVKGKTFNDLISQADALLTLYADPVTVTIVSDAQTEIILSTVGQLGRFANKTVQLRPGEYTVIGSQDGCRDVRQNFIVRPDMQPVTVRCNEFLNP